MTPKPESETDPWARVRTFDVSTYGDCRMERDYYGEITSEQNHQRGEYAWVDEVDAARAAEATQHQQEVATLRAERDNQYTQAVEATQRALLAEQALANVEAERDREGAEHERTVDEFNGLADNMERLIAERDRLKAALEGVMPFIATQAMACGGMKCREMWCESCFGEDEAREFAQAGADAMGIARAALSGEGTAKP